MNLLTLVALYWLVFNSLWLCGLFTALAVYGEVSISEPNQFIAGFEVVLTLGMAILGIDRMLKVRELR